MRYVIKFSVRDRLALVSHLEWIRLFERLFRREGIKLYYSEGFNPHPKMVFAGPRPLGVESESEYLEVHTQDSGIEKLQGMVLPRDGRIEAVQCVENMPKVTKRVKYVCYTFYDIMIEEDEEVRGIIDRKEEKDRLLINTAVNFSFSRFARGKSFSRVCRKVVLI